MEKSAERVLAFQSISEEMMTPAEVAEAKGNTHFGDCIAGFEKILAVRELEEVNKRLIEGCITASETALAYDGPCRISENGVLVPLYGRTWNALTEEEKNRFWELPESERAWAHSGIGNVTVYLVKDSEGHSWLNVAVDRNPDYRGYVIWVKGTSEEDAQQENDVKAQLRNQGMTYMSGAEA